jgi:hypothetical protein
MQPRFLRGVEFVLDKFRRSIVESDFAEELPSYSRKVNFHPDALRAKHRLWVGLSGLIAVARTAAIGAALPMLQAPRSGGCCPLRDLGGGLGAGPVHAPAVLRFKAADLGSCQDIIVGANRLLASLAHQPPPAEHQAGREPMTTGNITDRHAGLHRLSNHGNFQIAREASPTGDTSDHLNLRERVGHRHMPRPIPRLSGFMPVSGQNGVQFMRLETHQA